MRTLAGGYGQWLSSTKKRAYGNFLKLLELTFKAQWAFSVRISQTKNYIFTSPKKTVAVYLL